MTLESLIGRRIFASDGACLGRIFNFQAERRGGDVLITHLCIGRRAWLEVLWPQPSVRHRIAGPALHIPWEALAAVEPRVTLKDGWTAARCRTPHPLAE